MKAPALWIGLAEVVPISSNERYGQIKGAAVQVLALATSRGEFRKAVKAALAKEQFHLTRLSDSEPFEERVKSSCADDEIWSLANEVMRTGATGFSTFFTFNED
jgi:hypothetical protein